MRLREEKLSAYAAAVEPGLPEAVYQSVSAGYSQTHLGEYYSRYSVRLSNADVRSLLEQVLRTGGLAAHPMMGMESSRVIPGVSGAQTDG